jgi:hypothetical protein
MFKIRKLTSILLISGAMLISCGIVGCSSTPKPSTEESGKLEEARAAAESAERKLSELRQERMRLEQELQSRSVSLQPKNDS